MVAMTSVLAGKKIVVGVTGSIAAFKVVGWVSTLTKEEANVSVIMTESAQKFIGPHSFAGITGEAPYCSMFNEEASSAMAHIDLAQEADAFIIAPATAQTIARLAHGLADDLLSATVLATRAPVIICPAMNSQMYLHHATQDNIQKLKGHGYVVIDPASGLMACKDEGPGRLIEWQDACEVLLRSLGSQPLSGKKVLVTAGPTRETIDPARFISNRSSGKMGYALARQAYRLGAEVVLISGPTALECPFGIRRKMVTSAQQMYDAVFEEFNGTDIIVKSAAVSDFKPAKAFDFKIKKDRAEDKISLVMNPDILREIGQRRNTNQVIIGFAAESDNVIDEARKKLKDKNLDLIVVNDISSEDSGFEVDTNRVILIDKNSTKDLPLTSKMETAKLILDHICSGILVES